MAKRGIYLFLVLLFLTSVLASGAGRIQSAQFNQNRVIADGRELDLSGQPMISVQEAGVAGIWNYMPVRAVLEQMGYEVAWDGAQNTVVVKSTPTPAPPSPPPEPAPTPSPSPSPNPSPSPKPQPVNPFPAPSALPAVSPAGCFEIPEIPEFGSMYNLREITRTTAVYSPSAPFDNKTVNVFYRTQDISLDYLNHYIDFLSSLGFRQLIDPNGNNLVRTGITRFVSFSREEGEYHYSVVCMLNISALQITYSKYRTSYTETTLFMPPR